MKIKGVGMKKNELETPYLDNEVVNGPRESREELAALKLFAANQFIQNYCEVFGVPEAVMTDDPEKLIEWARNEYQAHIDSGYE